MTDRLRPPIRACVFDAFGTLLDVNSAVAREAVLVGARVAELSALWRRKQLEYSWLRSLMRQHRDFWQITQDALDHSLSALALDPATLREPLLKAYGELAPYPEVPAMLRRLREHKMTAAVLSNGSPSMLRRSFAAAGLSELIEPLLSVEAAGIFKPAPETYLIATQAVGLPAERIAFFSSNAWDVHGAACFGFQTVWVNRTEATDECLPGVPALRLTDLAEVPQRIGLVPGGSA